MIAGLGLSLAALVLPPSFPAIVAVPACVCASMLFGAAWVFMPGVLQAKRGSNVVIATVMFDFIASTLIIYLLVEVLKPAASMNPESAPFPPNATLPSLQAVASAAGFGPALDNVNLAFPLALATAFAVWILLWKTRLGYRIRTVGFNPSAAAYAGISPARITIIAMLLSGVVSGLLAINELLGFQQRLVFEFTAGAGFVGIRFQSGGIPLLGHVPAQAIQVLPYLPTVVLLAGFMGAAAAPKAAGVAYVKERQGERLLSGSGAVGRVMLPRLQQGRRARLCRVLGCGAWIGWWC